MFTVLPPLKLIESSLRKRLEALGTPEITKIMFTVVQLLKLIDSPLQQVITTALLSLGEILLYYPLGKRLEALGTSDIT